MSRVSQPRSRGVRTRQDVHATDAALLLLCGLIALAAVILASVP